MRASLGAGALIAALAVLPGAATAHLPAAAAGGDRGWLVAPRTVEGCPTAVDPERFDSADALFEANAMMASYGERPTGSPAHRRFVDDLERRLEALPGVQLESIAYPFDRWTPRRVALRARTGGGEAERVRVAGPVPYAEAAPRGGVAGPLVYVPAETPISEVDVSGKIVVRDAVTVSVPNAAIAALSWWSYDPELVLARDVADAFERENAGEARIADLEAAGEGGAAALIIAHGLPHEQVRGQYAPYEGVRWPVPALYVGVDEGARLKELAERDGTARVRLDATVKRVETRMVIATLPGLSDEKIVVQSHTDGMNAVWDNGPVAMLSMAEWFARAGRECRPRTLMFAFTTGHLHQRLVPPDRDGSAEQLADRLDREYDRGTVALVVPVEHMGARRWVPVPRGGGRPGRVLEPTDRNEPTSIFIGESPALISTTLRVVAQHDLRETIALRGADLPGLQLPPHDSFGGEGNPYLHHLIPTVALITAPWTLFDPAFTLEELVDKRLLREQTLVFTDLVHAAATQPRELLGGGYVGYRAARSLTCGTALEALRLVRHCTVP